ncbi:MAG: ABC transporter permease subunit [Aminipila sp.]
MGTKVLRVKQKQICTKELMQRDRKGNIRISTKSKSTTVIKCVLCTLLALTVFALLTLEQKEIQVGKAIIDTTRNFGIAFFQPRLRYNTFFEALYQLMVTFSLGMLSTIIGAFAAFFLALLCASNIANPKTAMLIKGFVSFIRAVPTILWVLIFAVTAGLGSVAAVIGLSFHSISYLVKAYSEAIEEIDYGTIEALKASGAYYWQIIFQAVLPSVLSLMLAWTFMRFEINFANAVAMGAAAGAGGVGYSLFMAGSFYFDLRETGFFTILIVITVILLEMISTKIKEKVK